MRFSLSGFDLCGGEALLARDCVASLLMRSSAAFFASCLQGRRLTVRVQAYGMKAEYIWADGNEGKAEKASTARRAAAWQSRSPTLPLLVTQPVQHVPIDEYGNADSASPALYDSRPP